MNIKGIRSIKPEKVDLSRFFDEPHSVTIRPLSSTARAKIQELTISGFRYATKQSKTKLDIEAIEQAMPAAITIELRELKLTDAVIDHDIRGEDGELLPWGKDLWDELDKADPRILAKVFEKIDVLSFPEDEEDPTSPAKSGKK